MPAVLPSCKAFTTARLSRVSGNLSNELPPVGILRACPSRCRFTGNLKIAPLIRHCTKVFTIASHVVVPQARVTVLQLNSIPLEEHIPRGL